MGDFILSLKLTGLALIAALLAGCSDETAESSPNESASSTEVIPGRSEPAVQLSAPFEVAPLPEPPLSQVRLSASDVKFRYETWQLGMKMCMTKLGFTYDPVDFDLASPLPQFARNTDEIKQYGYHYLPGYSDELLVTENDRRLQESADYKDALLGGSDTAGDGCRGEAYGHTYDDDGEFATLDSEIGQAQADALASVDASDVMGNLNAEWSACMSKSGFEYTAPPDAHSRFSSASAVTDEEIRTRLADHLCQSEVGYVDQVSTMYSEAVNVWIDQNPDVLSRYSILKDQYLKDLLEYRSTLG